MEPRILHKYRSLSGNYGLTNVEDIVLHDRMRWQSPAFFNDPFDCAPELTFGFGKAERHRFAKDAANKFESSLNRKDRRALSAKITKRQVSDVETELKNMLRRNLENSSVSCFSLDDRQPLMWAHYADSHAGLCFSFEEDMPVGFFGLNVRYQSNREIVDLTKFGEHGADELAKTVLTKSLDWAYEKEVRMIQYNRAPGVRPFPQKLLKRVTLGLRVSSDNEEAIRAMVSRRRLPLEVHRVAIRDGSFELDSIPV